jgi:hypothetical protein
MGVLEATLAALGDGGPQSACNNDIIRVLLYQGRDTFFLRSEVRSDLRESLRCCKRVSHVSCGHHDVDSSEGWRYLVTWLRCCNVQLCAFLRYRGKSEEVSEECRL